MKTVITILTAVMVNTAVGFGQQNFNVQVAKDSLMAGPGYLEKSKAQSAMAWLMVSGATVTIVTGAVILANQLGDEFAYGIGFEDAPNSERLGKGATCIIVGIGLAVGGAVLFGAAHKSRKKARLTFQSEKASLGLPVEGTSSIHGIKLSISLSK